MGYLVNATAFRLGGTKKWVSSWAAKKRYKIFLHKDFLLFRFIKLFFMQYSVPIFPYSNVRNKGKTEYVKVSGKSNIIPNQFVDIVLHFLMRALTEVIVWGSTVTSWILC